MARQERRRSGKRIAPLLLALLLFPSACGSESRSSNGDQSTSGPTTQGLAREAQRKPKADDQQVTPRAAKKIDPVVPVRVVIPSIGVSAPVMRLGLNPDRTLEVPEDYSLTGWWSGGAAPGERGPAVIVGHIDSKTGPAVFYRLRELSAADKIKVVGRDGSSLWFEVERLEQHPKDSFPTEHVYGDTGAPTLRLVTCGGEFDQSTGHYLDNTIAFASLAGSGP